jgi:hypothetical protein
MDFPMKELIAGAVTLVVAGFGYAQWTRGKRSGRFIEDRETAYNEVWQSLESAHLLVRAGGFDPAALDTAITNANTLLIRHGLHLAESDKEEAARYIAAVRNLGSIMSSVPMPPQSKRDMEITDEHPALSGELLTAYNEHQAARQRVMDRFRRAIGAGQI